MSEDTTVMPDELTILKERAKLLGITHSNNISVETLRAKIDAKLFEKTEEAELADDGSVNDDDPGTKPMNLRTKLLMDATRLVRLRITNLDPKKKDLPGEILCVANEYIGTVKKFIPFGEVTEDGYHVPYCLYQMMKDRKFLNIRTIKGPNGRQIVRHNWAPEFALEVLPQLTQEDLNKLAAAQQAAGLFIDNDSQF
jgi:hypothetical protein